jgi:hypothetical protein
MARDRGGAQGSLNPQGVNGSVNGCRWPWLPHDRDQFVTSKKAPMIRGLFLLTGCSGYARLFAHR